MLHNRKKENIGKTVSILTIKCITESRWQNAEKSQIYQQNIRRKRMKEQIMKKKVETFIIKTFTTQTISHTTLIYE